MFEAKLLDGCVLKKIVEAIKDVVTDVNIDFSASDGLLDDEFFELLFCSNFNLQVRLNHFLNQIVVYFFFSMPMTTVLLERLSMIILFYI